MNRQGYDRDDERQRQTVQMINFTAGGDEYAVDIGKVREVINFREITPLPKAPGFVKGIINLRGEVIPIVDLREKFGLERGAYTPLTNIIIVEIGRKAVGVVVDEVRHVIRVDQEAVAPPPPFVGGLSGRYVEGVASHDERLIVVLDMEKILTVEEMIALEAMDSGSTELGRK